jgi:hypothetical protein
MRKTVWIYGAFGFTYENCTDVEISDIRLAFTDCNGDRHVTTAHWEVITHD